MKPTPLSEYLATPAENRAPGWVVVMRGAGAPSVVHPSRGAAEAEASRLIEGLPGTVDQTALVMPIASVLTRKKDVRQPITGEAYPIDVKEEDRSLGHQGVKRLLSEFDEGSETMATLCGKPQTGVEIASATACSRLGAPPAPFVKPHGIYQRRDGLVVGPIKDRGDEYSQARWTDGDLIWYTDGNFSALEEHPNDLIREIVGGEGWKPWNGGECPVAPTNEVEAVLRDGSTITGAGRALYWGNGGRSYDILAYRRAF